ncbi:MAG: DUF2007 domain-containing protein [Actinobacteria bacterium]|nr:DUF2007 domain-containing protein [Actinomycetota bacterium]
MKKPWWKRSKAPEVPGGWVEVAVAPNQMVAGMLEGAVKDIRIPVIVDRPGAFAYTGSGGVHGILVPGDREEEARSLLAEIWDVTEEA